MFFSLALSSLTFAEEKYNMVTDKDLIVEAQTLSAKNDPLAVNQLASETLEMRLGNPTQRFLRDHYSNVPTATDIRISELNKQK